ncbi:hypothetical protein B0H19DRAFT_1137801 [Mycena capillaripes]|nr:hypothetical protein B0H19DRAFT_1137801 [Mycena capillaripes]
MAFAYTASQRRSRPHLRRVSFRLLVYALVSNFVLSVTLIPMENLMTGPPPSAGCTFAAFTSNASLLFSACMYFCMALNLQLVLIHGVNGLMMEKYYVIGSSLLVGVCSISPWPQGNSTVFTTISSIWIFLMASSELVFFVILMLYMLRRRRIRSDISAEMTSLQYAAYSAAPILQFRGIILRIGTFCTRSFPASSTSPVLLWICILRST